MPISGRNVQKLTVEDQVLSNQEDGINNSLSISEDCLMVRKIVCSEESIYVGLTTKYLPMCNYKALEKSNLNKLQQITTKVLLNFTSTCLCCPCDQCFQMRF